MALAQFHLADASYGEMIGISGRRDRSGYRNDSSVFLEFLFERQTGFFLLQIYTPLTLIVFCSWVTFWLVKTETVTITQCNFQAKRWTPDLLT